MTASTSPLALVIEDDAASAEALAFILRDWGAEVVCAAAANHVYAALGARLSDLRWVITDFNLGDGDNGVEVALHLASTAPQARILVLSGSFQGRAAEAAERAGLDFMNKPARADAIITWIERA